MTHSAVQVAMLRALAAVPKPGNHKPGRTESDGA
jgi:hypothetical protein